MDRFIKELNINNRKYGIRLMKNTSTDEQDIFFNLFYECFGIRPTLDKQWFNWYYNDNPYGICNNYLMFDLDHNILVGAYGFAKIMYAYKSKNYTGVLGVNGMISKDYTKQGLYAELMNIGLENETKNNLAFSFPHGNNTASIKGHYKSNWQLYEDLMFYQKNIKRPKNIKKAGSIKQLSKNELINIDFKTNTEFSFIKNANFIKWRYFDRPYKEYIIIGNYLPNNKINGYMILGKYKERNNNIRCQIVDFNVKSIEVLDLLLENAEYYANELKANIIDLIISKQSEYLKLLINKNYRPSGELYKLLVYPTLLSNSISNALLGDFDAV